VINESALWAELEPAGFVKVRLEEMTWPEQINAFRHAKVIVAPHGAGLANLAFCRPGTRVIEFFHRAYVSGCYWRLAALQGLDYHAVVPESPGPLGATPESNRLDLVADLPQVRAARRSG
jgi:capsular polysaccharide biosynthesis protein